MILHKIIGSRIQIQKEPLGSRLYYYISLYNNNRQSIYNNINNRLQLGPIKYYFYYILQIQIDQIYMLIFLDIAGPNTQIPIKLNRLDFRSTDTLLTFGLAQAWLRLGLGLAQPLRPQGVTISFFFGTDPTQVKRKQIKHVLLLTIQIQIDHKPQQLIFQLKLKDHSSVDIDCRSRLLKIACVDTENTFIILRYQIGQKLISPSQYQIGQKLI